MKNPFPTRAPSFDTRAIRATIQKAFASAGLNSRVGLMREVSDSIGRALGAGRQAATSSQLESVGVIDVPARVIPEGDARWAPPDRDASIGALPPSQPGSFTARQFSNAAGTRSYKTYVPAASPQGPHAVVVMLHGCTQSADDFAAGTQMNRLADAHGFLVVYPEQAAQANPSKCWNWFQPQDQRHGAGEPSLIAGIVDEVLQGHGADPRRVFVAGLSAGAAMAVVMGQTYPELFAGVGAHSGLPYGSAHDIASALAAMKGGRSGLPGLKLQPADAKAGRKRAVQAVPIIVFHGDRDHTVQQTNGADIARQARQAHGAQFGEAALRESTQAGVAKGGRRYSRTVHADAQGRPQVESWTMHGAGHAWSGGHASGSYTDPTGPDASAEMVRFFLALPQAGTA